MRLRKITCRKGSDTTITTAALTNKQVPRKEEGRRRGRRRGGRERSKKEKKKKRRGVDSRPIYFIVQAIAIGWSHIFAAIFDEIFAQD